jgi:hypothetical protein
MPIDRRKLLALASLTALGSNWKPAAAAEERALFWRVEFGDSSAVLFGYERIAAALVPDVLKDGFRLIDDTRSVALDLSPVIKFPPIQIDRKNITPLSNVVSRPTADQLHEVYAKFPQMGPMADLLSPFEVTTVLMGEGQSPPNPSAGGTIADRGKILNRPVTILVTDAEAQGLWNPPDMVALNKSIDESRIKYLLDLRQQVGPIGAHLEALYRDRRSEEINRFTGDIKTHGIPSMSGFLPPDRVRPLMLDRLVKTAAASATTDPFVLLPLGLLTGADGILAQLRNKGSVVTALV